MKAYTAARWASGVPLWNPLSGCGEPWLAQLQTGVFNPGDLPFLLSGAWGPLLGIALHLAIASSGMAAWLSGLGTSRAGALLGAGVFAGGGCFLSLALVYNNFETAAFLPWLFLAARHAARGGSPAGLCRRLRSRISGRRAGAGRRRRRAPRRSSRSRREATSPAGDLGGLRGASRLAGGLVLGAGLAAAAGGPFLEYATSAGRLTGVTKNEALARPVGTSDLIDLVLPPSDALLFRPSEGRGGYLTTLALVSARSPARGRSGRGPRGAPPPPRRACRASRSPASSSRSGRAAGSSPSSGTSGLARGVRFPARWFVFTQLALAGLAGAGLDGWLHGRFFRWPKGRAPEDGADVSPSVVSRLAPAVLFGVSAAALLGAGAAAGRLTGLPAWTALLAAGAGAVLLAFARAARQPGSRLQGVLLAAILASASSRVGKRVCTGGARTSAIRRDGAGRGPGAGVSGGLGRAYYSRRSSRNRRRVGRRVGARERARGAFGLHELAARPFLGRLPVADRKSTAHAAPRRGPLGAETRRPSSAPNVAPRRVSVSDDDPRRAARAAGGRAFSSARLSRAVGTRLLRAIGPRSGRRSGGSRACRAKLRRGVGRSSRSARGIPALAARGAELLGRARRPGRAGGSDGGHGGVGSRLRRPHALV